MPRLPSTPELRTDRRLPSGAAFALAALVLCQAFAAPAAAATPTTHAAQPAVDVQPPTDAEPPTSLTVTAERVGDTEVAYTYRFDFDADAGEVAFLLEDAVAVANATGVSEEPIAGGHTRFVRDDGAATATVRVVENVTDASLATGTADHLFARALPGELRWDDGDDALDLYRTADHPDDWTFQAAGEGVFTPTMVYFGPHETVTRTVDGQRITLVVSPAVGDRFDPEARLAAVAETARKLDLGAADGNVTGFVVGRERGPDRVVRTVPTLAGMALSTFSRSFFVYETTRNKTLRHEYVHTQQDHVGASDSTWWLVEGSATYYANLHATQAGALSPSEFRYSLNVSEANAGAVLALPSTWTDAAVPYVKGERVVAFLDQRIRAETDGERTFQAVVREINARGGLSGNDELGAIVANVSGNETLGELVVRYARTDSDPSADHAVYGHPDLHPENDATSDDAATSTATATVAPGTVDSVGEPTSDAETPGFTGPATLAALAAALLLARRSLRPLQ